MSLPVLSRIHLPSSEFEELERRAREDAINSKSANTRRIYSQGWAHFTEWCELRGRDFLPALPQTVAHYLEYLDEDHKPATLRSRLSAISMAHEAAGFPTPTRDIMVRVVITGIERRRGAASDQKTAALASDLARMIDSLDAAIKTSNPRGRSLQLSRDRSLLLLGFAGGFRRSEIVSLTREDVKFKGANLVVTLRRSKTDQAGRGREIGIEPQANAAHCPVRSLKAWLKDSCISEGPLYRSINRHGVMGPALSPHAVATVVKRAAAAAGLDPTLYAGHSLRSGFATSAAAAGANDRSIMKQTGHRSRTMVDRYVQSASLFEDNASGRIRI